jgi:filamin
VCPGKGKPSQIKETSALVVETVEKKPGAAPKKKFVGDASKVVAKGNGLQKAFMGRPATFTVDTKDAG